MHNEIIMIGDKVFYCGEKYRQELGGKIGWVHATVDNQPDSFCVEYPDTKEHDSFVQHTSVLTKWRPSKGEKHDGPDIQPRRRKKEDD